MLGLIQLMQVRQHQAHSLAHMKLFKSTLTSNGSNFATPQIFFATEVHWITPAAGQQPTCYVNGNSKINPKTYYKTMISIFYPETVNLVSCDVHSS